MNTDLTLGQFDDLVAVGEASRRGSTYTSTKADRKHKKRERQNKLKARRAK